MESYAPGPAQAEADVVHKKTSAEGAGLISGSEGVMLSEEVAAENAATEVESA